MLLNMCLHLIPETCANNQFDEHLGCDMPTGAKARTTVRARADGMTETTCLQQFRIFATHLNVLPEDHLVPSNGTGKVRGVKNLLSGSKSAP